MKKYSNALGKSSSTNRQCVSSKSTTPIRRQKNRMRLTWKAFSSRQLVNVEMNANDR